MSNNLLRKMPSESVSAYTASGHCGDSDTSGSHTENESPAGGEKLEARVVALEKVMPEIRERLVRVETRLDGVDVRLKNIEENMATRADLELLRKSVTTDMELLRKSITVEVQTALAEVKTTCANVERVAITLTWRFIQISLVLAGIAFTAGKFIN